MGNQCKFYRLKGIVSMIHYCSLIDETIDKNDVDVCFSDDEDACEFYKFYIKKKREAIISEKIKEELS